jgi:hypothetical protein
LIRFTAGFFLIGSGSGLRDDDFAALLRLMEFLTPYPQAHSVSPISARARRTRPGRRARSPFAARLRAFDRVEVARLRAHFRRVHDELSRRDVSSLSPAQRAARAALIAELGRYARRGRFPKNLDFVGQRVPYFVDAFGTRCAMAHLIEHTGASAFVERIAAQHNNAFVPAIAGDPQLIAWLTEAGLSAAEAARIQPSYCGIPLSTCGCGIQTTSDGPLLEARLISSDSGGLQHAQVTAIHWQQPNPTAQVMGNYVVGMKIETWSGDGEEGDTILVFGNDVPTAEVHSVGPGMLFHDGMAKDFCSESTPDLTKETALEALLATNGDCGAVLVKEDAGWAETFCTSNGCSIGLGQSASLAVPGVIGLLAAAWAGRRIARRRVRARRAAGREHQSR